MDIKLTGRNGFATFSPSGGMIAVADTTAKASLFMLPTGRAILKHAFDAPHARSRGDLAHGFSPDGRYYALSREFRLQVLDLTFGEVVCAIDISKDERVAVSPFAFLDAGNVVLSDAGRLYAVDIATGAGRDLCRIPDAARCGGLDAAPNGAIAWFTSSEEWCDTVHLVEAATGARREVELPVEPLPGLRGISQSFMSHLAFADSGRTLRVLRKGRGLLDIDVASGTVRRERTWDALGCLSIHAFPRCRFSGGGRFLALAGEQGRWDPSGFWSVPVGGQQWRLWDLDRDELVFADTTESHDLAFDAARRRVARIRKEKDPRRERLEIGEV